MSRHPPLVLALLTALVSALAAWGPGGAAAAEGLGWRLDRAVGGPAWLDLHANYRSRFEPQDNPLRPDEGPRNGGVFLRALAGATVTLTPLRFEIEVIDARAPLAAEGTPLAASLADPFDVLQASLRFGQRDLMGPGSELWVRVGRMTLDVGSRRLVARNRFRNTINAFTGGEAGLAHPALGVLQLVVLAPVRRMPQTLIQKPNQSGAPDETAWGALLAGLHFEREGLPLGLRLDSELLALHERDQPGVLSRDRRLMNAGLRLSRAPRRGVLDGELEVILQGGFSRLTTRADDQNDLAHRAGFFHAQLGYTLDHRWLPRLAAHYDYASGDADPTDGKNQRFDTLFGARRFELGPSGTFGLYARSNLNSPAIRAQAQPSAHWHADVIWRPAWLAARRDVWTTTGLQDPSGRTDPFLGQLVEARLHWDALPGNLALELGATGFWFGAYARNAPGAPATGTTAALGYLQVSVSL